MQDGKVFRERIEVEEVPEQKAPERETPNLVEERIDGALKDPGAPEEIKRPSPLEEWEIEHGKYGLEFFDIKEIASEFPLKVHFSEVDKYIKGLIGKNGFDMTPQRYQETLDSIEKEIGSQKLGVYERLKKLAEYVKIVKKMDDLEERKKMLTR